MMNQKSQKPLITVAIPTYRRLTLLQRAIESVRKQTYTEWELVISDDEVEYGETWDYLSDLVRTDHRVRAIKNTGTHGQVGNTNNAMKEAKGTWIKFLHDDDVLKPTCLKELVRVSNIRDNIACITCGVERFDNGILSSSYWREGWPTLEVIPESEILTAMYYLENTGGAMPSQKMIHRRVLDRGIFMEQPPGLRWMVDSWFNVRIASCGDLVIYRKPLVEWHQGVHLTETESLSDLEKADELFLFKKLLWDELNEQSRVPSLSAMNQMLYLQRAILHFKRLNWQEGLSMLSKAWHPQAYWIFLLWTLHNVTRGRFSKSKRFVIQKELPLQANISTSEVGRHTLLYQPESIAAPVQRIVVLFSRLSGYMAASLKRLHQHYGVELLVFRIPPQADAPYEARYFEWINQLYDRDKFETDEMLEIIEQFDPDAVFMSGWLDRGYLKVARLLREQGIPVVAGSDAQWKGSLKQQLGRLVAPWYLHSAIDVLWVAGERQRQFANKLGFEGENCWSGYYTCDWDTFAEIYQHSTAERKRAFLYVGRYVGKKGLDVLLEAYHLYRSTTSQPWTLICVGAGEDKELLSGKDGVTDNGFIQPEYLPGLMGQASGFILPSIKEPWGVVVHEAATAGLPLICSDACGAAVHLVQDQYNGFLFHSGNAQHLAHCMMRMSKASQEEWDTMSERSHMLSKQYTPQRWADTLIQGIQDVKRRPIN